MSADRKRPRVGREPLDRTLVLCAECGRPVTESDAIAQHWTYWSDGVGELVPFCPECAAREFGV